MSSLPASGDGNRPYTLAPSKPTSGRVLEAGDPVGIGYLTGSTRQTVDFSGALQNAWEAGVISTSTAWVEIGHHPTCSGFITRTLPSTRLACTSLHRDLKGWTTLAKALSALYEAGVDIDWNEYHSPFERALRLVDLPTYAWKNTNNWIDYRGEWNLTKGRELEIAPSPTTHPHISSSIHRIISEHYNDSKAHVSAETSITDPSLQDVVDGHAMNGHGVASSVSTYLSVIPK